MAKIEKAPKLGHAPAQNDGTKGKARGAGDVGGRQDRKPVVPQAPNQSPNQDSTLVPPVEVEARKALRSAGSDGKITGADRKQLLAAGLEQPQIKMLQAALKKDSDAKTFLSRAEVTAIFRNEPLPDPDVIGPRRLKRAVSDGQLTGDDRKHLLERGVAKEQIAKLRQVLRENGGKPITTAQAMEIWGRTLGGVDNGTGGGGNVGGLTGPTPMSDVNADGYQLAKVATQGGNGGQTDATGKLYVPVGKTLQVYGPDNKPLAVAKLPFAPVDVAPGPNGDYIYAVDGRVPKKLVRGADGNYTVDPNFKLEAFPYGGKDYDPQAYRIATDHSGNLFVADGMWSENMLHTVIKYDAAGKYQTRFGEYASGNKEDAASWKQGEFYWGLGGIAVSPDGNTVYTTEVGNSRVQKWDANDQGVYASTAMWGNTQATDPNRTGSDKPGQFAAPYDIGLDGDGNVYVMNTTVAQIQKFTADGQFITSMFMGDDPDVRDERLRGHSIAVSERGDAISVETGRMMMRGA